MNGEVSGRDRPSEPARGAEAVVLVGGRGTRLRPLTLSAPKPMLPTAGVPFLTHLLSRIREAGITRVVLGTSYQPDVFAEHFGDPRFAEEGRTLVAEFDDFTLVAGYFPNGGKGPERLAYKLDYYPDLLARKSVG